MVTGSKGGAVGLFFVWFVICFKDREKYNTGKVRNGRWFEWKGTGRGWKWDGIY